ncbi:hypothetical protein CNY89_05410 [Amaricoccus sp. HAR-UPW-R2A-40]|nr:hypothetical protein CNY89_05410 [Amaricoccus sp. HAR-UPW-R2A-40]
MEAIKPGDVVKLKSGGKAMVVEDVSGGLAHVCAERNGVLMRWQVSIVALSIAEPSKGLTYRGAL